MTSWAANEMAVRRNALQQAEIAKQTIAAAQATRLQAQEEARYLGTRTAANAAAGINAGTRKNRLR